MDYKKIGLELLNANYIDERMLMCHAYRKYTQTSDRIIYMKLKTFSNSVYMPSFMLLSIKDDYLHISYAKLFGGFKKYYASFKLSSLKFEEEFTVDRIVKIYVFDIVKEDNTENKEDKFFLIAIKRKEDVKKLVDAIIEYNISV